MTNHLFFDEISYKGYCPSCMKEQERIAICTECIEKRDHKIEHSELDIQNQLKKDLDRYK